MKVYKFGLLAGVAMVLLTACGGGGGSSNADEGTDYTSKYVGTWKSGCEYSSSVLDATTGGAAYTTDTLVFTRTSNTTLNAFETIQVFAPTDTTCSQPSLGSIIWSGNGKGSFFLGGTNAISSAAVTVSVDAQTTIDGKMVDKVTYAREALTSTNGTFTVGSGSQFKFNSASYPASTTKNLSYLNGSNITFGNHSGIPNTEYPTTLASNAALTKQ